MGKYPSSIGNLKNIIKYLRYLFFTFIVCFGFITLIATGGVGDNDDDDCADVGDQWFLTDIMVDATDCSVNTEESSYWVSQDGCDIKVTSDNYGGSFSGSVDGFKIELSGEWNRDDGTISADIEMTISGEKQNELSGTAHWNWGNGDESCSGVTDLSGHLTFRSQF